LSEDLEQRSCRLLPKSLEEFFEDFLVGDKRSKIPESVEDLCWLFTREGEVDERKMLGVDFIQDGQLREDFFIIFSVSVSQLTFVDVQVVNNDS